MDIIPQASCLRSTKILTYVYTRVGIYAALRCGVLSPHRQRDRHPGSRPGTRNVKMNTST